MLFHANKASEQFNLKRLVNVDGCARDARREVLVVYAKPVLRRLVLRGFGIIRHDLASWGPGPGLWGVPAQVPLLVPPVVREEDGQPAADEFWDPVMEGRVMSSLRGTAAAQTTGLRLTIGNVRAKSDF